MVNENGLILVKTNVTKMRVFVMIVNYYVMYNL